MKSLIVILALSIGAIAQTQGHGLSLNVPTVGANSTSTCFYASAVSGGPYTKVTCVANAALPYLDPVTASNSGIQTFFVATGLNSFGESGFSSEKSGTFPVLPGIPAGVSATQQ